MKRTSVLLLLLLITAGGAYSSNIDLIISADWQFSLKAGVEYRFHPKIAVRADAGISPFGLLVLDTLCVFYPFTETGRFLVGFAAGIPNTTITLSFDAAMLSLGGSVVVAFGFTERIGVEARLGAGFPLFIEKGREVVRDISFPLNLWPDASVGVRIGLRGADG